MDVVESLFQSGTPFPEKYILLKVFAPTQFAEGRQTFDTIAQQVRDVMRETAGTFILEDSSHRSRFLGQNARSRAYAHFQEHAGLRSSYAIQLLLEGEGAEEDLLPQIARTLPSVDYLSSTQHQQAYVRAMLETNVQGVRIVSAGFQLPFAED